MKVMGWLGHGMDVDSKVFKEDAKSLNLIIKMHGIEAAVPARAGSGGSKKGGERDTRRCFKCGKGGHIAAKCTSTGTSDAAKKCYKCGDPGHIAKDCTKAGVPGKKSK